MIFRKREQIRGPNLKVLEFNYGQLTDEILLLDKTCVYFYSEKIDLSKVTHKVENILQHRLSASKLNFL